LTRVVRAAEQPFEAQQTAPERCLDWYLTTGPDNYIRTEGFLEDENGDPVIGSALN
jgi:hypothetical protein